MVAMPSRKRDRPAEESDAEGQESEGDGSVAADSDDSDADASMDDGDQQEESLGTVVLGTYEGGLIGLNVEDGKQVFGYAPHVGCVKALHSASSGKLASGGSDHFVRLFDLSNGTELGDLQEHDSTVACIEFWGSTTLVTGSDDGFVCIWRTHDFELLLKFRAHKLAVAAFAIHPSGRLLATAGRDRSVRLWDLTRGTSAASLKVDVVAEALKWSPSGTLVAVQTASEIVVVDAKTGETASWKDPSASAFMRVTISAAMFLTDQALLVGDGKGDLRVLRMKAVFGQDSCELEEVFKLPADEKRSRVKALSSLSGELGSDSTGSEQSLLIAVGTTNGRAELWQFVFAGKNAKNGGGTSKLMKPDMFERLWAMETNTRLTCLSLWLRPAGEAEEGRKTKVAAAAAAAQGGECLSKAERRRRRRASQREQRKVEASRGTQGKWHRKALEGRVAKAAKKAMSTSAKADDTVATKAGKRK